MITNLYFKSKKSFVPFVPTDIAGCQLWLKADAGITKDGSNYVSRWADQSGNGNDAVQATGSAQPMWVDNQLNGKPIVYFNASDFLQISATPVLGSFFIVLNYDCPPYTAHFNGYSAILKASISNYLLFGNSGTSIIMSYAPNPTIYINGFNNSNFSPITTYKIVELTCTPTTLTNETISGSNNQWIGNVAEILQYDTILSSADRLLVRNYLNTKYAIW